MVAGLFVLLTSTVLEIPPSGWKAIDVKIPQHGTTIDCQYEVRRGSRVQLLVANLREAQRFHRGHAFSPLYSTGFQTDGHFRYKVADAGEYILIIDNRIEGRFPTEVDLRIDLQETNAVAAQELPEPRRRAVVAISLFFFGLMVVFSARQFLRVT